MKTDNQRSVSIPRVVLTILIAAAALALIPMFLFDGQYRCFTGVVFLLIVIWGIIHFQKQVDRNFHMTLDTVGLFAKENGFGQLQNQGMRVGRRWGWRGYCQSAYEGTFEGRGFRVLAYHIHSTYIPHLFFELLVVCVDMPLMEGEMPDRADSEFEYDDVVKRMTAELSGSEVSKERIVEAMRAMAKELAPPPSKQEQEKR